MRRVSRIAVAGAATASLALALSACGGTSTEGGSSSDSDKGLAIAYDVGGKGDQSFNDAAYAGLEQAKKEFGYETADIEPTEGETDADKQQRLESLAKQGYNPVVGVGYAYAAAVKGAAEKYPDTTFGIVDDSTVQSKNVADLVFSEEEASYLAGVAAAKSTTTNVVGYVGGEDRHRHDQLLEAPLWENRILGHVTETPNAKGVWPGPEGGPGRHPPDRDGVRRPHPRHRRHRGLPVGRQPAEADRRPRDEPPPEVPDRRPPHPRCGRRRAGRDLGPHP
ncbi:hypothetical protein SGLAM104S_07537 [Streptomyces glaucescens]